MIRRALLASALVGAACSRLGESHDPALSGGPAATVFDTTRDAFSLPAPVLSREHRARFFVGNSFFNENWTSAPGSAESRDGLGPLFNARSCSSCHFKDGRGRPPDAGRPLDTMLIRISVPGRGPHGEPRPDPIYGDQIQGASVPQVPHEADVLVDYTEEPSRFDDGTPYSLRRPRYRLERLGYGAPSAGLLVSPRVAPAMIGLGLLEGVPDDAVLARSDPGDLDGDGVSGRPNRVWDVARKRHVLGRFGWKAEQPSVRQQTAGAFLGDMGITSSLFPHENHAAAQEPCAEQPSGGSPEVTDGILDSVVFYARALAVPARRNPTDPRVRRGEALFARARCTVCHVPTLATGAIADLPELSHQVFHPYTDLLLHDLGDGLADHRPSYEAGGREWRTPPLWGIGLVHKVNGHTFFLHDGRARDLSEAILWHGGEASAAQRAFLGMSGVERAALIAFLESL